MDEETLRMFRIAHTLQNQSLHNLIKHLNIGHASVHPQSLPGLNASNIVLLKPLCDLTKMVALLLAK